MVHFQRTNPVYMVKKSSTSYISRMKTTSQKFRYLDGGNKMVIVKLR